jgi:hypothetical protein
MLHPWIRIQCIESLIRPGLDRISPHSVRYFGQTTTISRCRHARAALADHARDKPRYCGLSCRSRCRSPVYRWRISLTHAVVVRCDPAVPEADDAAEDQPDDAVCKGGSHVRGEGLPKQANHRTDDHVDQW